METIHVVTTPERHRTELGVDMTTARLGDKWLHKVSIGDEVLICRCETGQGPHVVTGKGVITGLDFRNFCFMPDEYIEKNHSLGSNASYESLAKAMKAAYGDEFSRFSEVTTIFYKRTENFPDGV